MFRGFFPWRKLRGRRFGHARLDLLSTGSAIKCNGALGGLPATSRGAWNWHVGLTVRFVADEDRSK